MGKFVSDEEMNALQEQAPKSKKFISDEEMSSMASSAKPKQEPAPLVAEEDKPWGVTSFFQGMGRTVPGGSWIDEAEGKIGSALGFDEEAWREGSLERYDRSKHTNPILTGAGELVGRGMGYVIGSKLGPVGALAESALHGAGDSSPGQRMQGAALNSVATGLGMGTGAVIQKVGAPAVNLLSKVTTGRGIPQPIMDWGRKILGGQSGAKPTDTFGKFEALVKAKPPNPLVPSAPAVGGIAGNSAIETFKRYYSSKKFRDSQR